MRLSFKQSLVEGKKKHGVALIAEIKKASPSAGVLNSSVDVMAQARIYETSGAAAISVLTEAQRFNGSLQDLRMVSQSVAIPTLRKDFITHKNQIDEAKNCGAGAVLLIVRNLVDEQLQTLFAYAKEIDLDVLVETHTAEEVARAVSVGADSIGVNARNLETLQIDTKIFEELLPLIPDNCIKVAESGIHTRQDVQHATACGADVVLVGSAIMRSTNPGEKIRELLNYPIVK